MDSGWSSDFSYGYYRKLLQAAKSNFALHLFSEVPGILQSNWEASKLLLRHDVDLDLNRAFRMAQIENELGISSTYMVMINSPLYSLDDSSSQQVLLSLLAMGHEIGLHFDFDDKEERTSTLHVASIEPKLQFACERLEAIICAPVRSISFHRPLPQFLGGPLFAAGRVNAYGKELMAWYLSDSKGNWREGAPLPLLLNADRPLLQLLVHPIWWGDEHMSPENRLQAFFEAATQGYLPERARAFDAALAGHLTIRRSGSV